MKTGAVYRAMVYGLTRLSAAYAVMVMLGVVITISFFASERQLGGPMGSYMELMKIIVVSLFTGGTTESSGGETSTSFSLGLDYERRLSRLVGLAGGGELALGGEERDALVGLYFLLHATEGLVLAAGPGKYRLRIR